MNKEWSEKLNGLGIKFEETEDSITFYDPHEAPDHVTIRKHMKFEEDINGYISRRMGKMSYDEFKEKFNS